MDRMPRTRSQWRDQADRPCVRTAGRRSTGTDAQQGTMAATVEDVRTALAAVKDPEIRRPITDLGMVERICRSTPAGVVELTVLLTIAACPLRDTLAATSPPPSARCPASPTCG